jgi:hypothetical protein
MEHSNDQEAFAQSIKSWNTEHLGRCLVATNVNEVAKDTIRAELQNRGVNLDQVTARAATQNEASKATLTRKQNFVVWVPTVGILSAVAIGIYMLIAG